ncbi:uncharacterized protein LOC124944605 [Impatiens glandulifera]|uniref:uncharacterized protein LOC124944605 n=1 Tax=Impatiens glandulifera TaxID=253017 RepID=UPI001FB0FB0C|nr:uncharacterized protein LOC124944605 [Impatiens glandulifera]
MGVEESSIDPNKNAKNSLWSPAIHLLKGLDSFKIMRAIRNICLTSFTDLPNYLLQGAYGFIQREMGKIKNIPFQLFNFWVNQLIRPILKPFSILRLVSSQSLVTVNVNVSVKNTVILETAQTSDDPNIVPFETAQI